MSILSLLSTDGFISVNKTLIKKLGLDAAVIVGELCSEYEYYRKRQDLTEDGYFFSTIKNIEERTTIKEKRQRMVMNELEKIGLIDVVKRGLPSKRFIRINELKLMSIFSETDDNNGQNEGYSSFEMAELERSFEATNKNITNKNITKENIINKNNSSTTSNDEVDKQFETWWNTYGKKFAKPKALTAFKKVIKKHGYPKLLEQTMQYVEPFVKGQKDRQYQQHPQTFLNAYDPDNDYTPQKGGYQQNEGFKRADDFDSFKARTGVDAPF